MINYDYIIIINYINYLLIINYINYINNINYIYLSSNELLNDLVDIYLLNSFLLVFANIKYQLTIISDHLMFSQMCQIVKLVTKFNLTSLFHKFSQIKTTQHIYFIIFQVFSNETFQNFELSMVIIRCAYYVFYTLVNHLITTHCFVLLF